MSLLVRSCAAVVLLAAVAAGQSPDPEKLPASPQEPKIVQGFLLKKVEPKYPKEARNARIQGTVVLHAIIDKSGRIQQLSLVSGHPMLAPAAIKAVKQWKYKPYLVDGKRIELDTTIEVNFVLDTPGDS